MNLKMRLTFYLLMFLGSLVINKRVTTQCKGIGIPESGKIMLENPQSWALESGIQLNESKSHEQLQSRFQVPLTETGIQYLESGIHGVESRIQDCLGFPYMEWELHRKCKSK